MAQQDCLRGAVSGSLLKVLRRTGQEHGFDRERKLLTGSAGSREHLQGGALESMLGCLNQSQ
jgi:hypothetical protein